MVDSTPKNAKVKNKGFTRGMERTPPQKAFSQGNYCHDFTSQIRDVEPHKVKTGGTVVEVRGKGKAIIHPRRSHTFYQRSTGSIAWFLIYAVRGLP